MDLNELNDLLLKVRVVETAVEEVKRRIINHRSDYDSNENATRYGLIDPILDALDWDVRDVAMVRTEYRLTSGPVDYALFDGTAPLAVIEAKRLSKTLGSSVSVQLLSYAIDVASIRYVVATNGDTWQMRERGQRNTVFDVKLSSGNSVTSALELIRMWRSVLVGDQAISPTGASADRQNLTQDKDSDAVPADVAPPTTPSDSRGWMTLEDVGFQTHDPWPKELILPGREREECKYYRTLWTKVANWLLETQNQQEWAAFFDDFVSGSLDELPHNRRRSARQLSNGLWLRRNYSTSNHGKNIKAALAHFGVDLRSVKLRFD